MSKHSASSAPACARDEGRARRAAGGPGQHGPGGVAGGGLEVDQAAVGLHDRRARAGPPRARAAEPAQVAGEQRRERGVDLGGRGALVLAERPDDLVRERYVDVRQRLRQRVADARARAPGGGRSAAAPPRPPRARPRRSGCASSAAASAVELAQRAVRGHPLGCAEAQLVGHERGRPRRAQPVELGAVLAPERDDVGEALGGDERGPGAAPLEQRVGGDGHAVGERLRPARRSRRPRSSAASTAAITPSDWSSGVVGALAVISRPSSASTASVKVPPTSTPSSIGRTLRAWGMGRGTVVVRPVGLRRAAGARGQGA